MKNTRTIILLGLLLCGFMQIQAVISARPAIDLVESGKDIQWQNGLVLKVVKRDGTSFEGIVLIKTASDGHKAKVSADTGTISPGSKENCVKIVVHHAVIEGQDKAGRTVTTTDEMTIELQKSDYESEAAQPAAVGAGR